MLVRDQMHAVIVMLLAIIFGDVQRHVSHAKEKAILIQNAKKKCKRAVTLIIRFDIYT